MADEPTIYVADAGSVAKGKFHWVSSRSLKVSSTDPEALARAIAADLTAGQKVSLGFESPLFLPVAPDKLQLGRARQGECTPATGNRSFNAGAGAAVLATGLQTLAWVLREVHQLCPPATATTRWNDFHRGDYQLFVWEAFVSGSEKADPPSHAGDAALAINAFRQVMHEISTPTRVDGMHSFSLAGAAILYAELSTDFSLLTEPCVVLRPLGSKNPTAGAVIEPNLGGLGYGS